MKKHVAILISLMLIPCIAWCQDKERMGEFGDRCACHDISKMPGWEQYYIMQGDTMFSISYYTWEDRDSVVCKPLEKIGRNKWISRSDDSTLYFELKLVRTCKKNKRDIPGKDYKLRSVTRYENGKRKFKAIYWWNMMYKKTYYNY